MEKRLSPFNVLFWIKKGLTQEAADFKVKSFKKVNTEYWTSRGFSKEESIQKVKDFQKAASKKRTEKIKSDPKKYREKIGTTIEFFLKKTQGDLGKARELQSNSQKRFSKKICIQKYGEKEGLLIWKKRQIQWQNTLSSKSKEEIERINKLKDCVTVDFFLRKGHSLEESLILNKEAVLKRMNFNSWSKESIVVLNPLYEKLLKILNKKDIYWKADEFFIHSKKGIYFYDFTIRSKKIIIEYNGSAFHPSPYLTEQEKNKWKSPYKKESYDTVKKYNDFKIQTAKDNGFLVFIIWDFSTPNEINKIFNKIIKLCNAH